MPNPEEPEHIVVVGGGAAAHRCVDAYRAAGGRARLTILSADDRLPYFRPYLTKELMVGAIAADAIGLDHSDWYAQREIDVRLRRRVSGVDLHTRTVLADDGPLGYDRLVLATGSSAASLPVPGADTAGLLSVRSAADALAIIEAVSDGAPAIVVGSGFVGCEVASSLRARGIDVEMLSMESMPQQERLGDEAAAVIGGWLRDAGVVLRGGIKVDAVERTSGSTVLHLADGSSAAAAHVIVASGARPNVELAASAGLPSEGGVQVDASMRTGAPGVYAVGDIANAYNESARRRLRVEHWDDAEEMGRIAGLGLAGQRVGWAGVPGFWSQITGRELKYSAWGDGFDEARTRSSADGFTIWYGRGGATVGVLTYEHDEDIEVGKDLIRMGAPLPTL